ncbi:hypothetical protein C6502_05675 [Candidatus Poribacteria bacterium]|nr:MAG: hypothetical protein C6502_05675 [Candidatus Poribacteria bacterium]
MPSSFVSRIALSGLPIVLFSIALLSVHQAIAEEPPAGVFSPRPGEFLSADSPHVFDRVLADGLTIEIWFFLAGEADVPEDWVLFGKKGSYWAEVRSTGQWWEVEVDVYRRWKNGGGHTHGHFDSKRLNQWLHVTVQIQGAVSRVFFNGKPRFGGGSKNNPGKLVRSKNPLIIGWRRRADNSSQKMWIDQVRISKTLRYPGEPSRPLLGDRDTLALWNFDEGLGARRYAEASGKRYTLHRHSPLAVDTKGKLTALWGEIKKSE